MIIHRLMFMITSIFLSFFVSAQSDFIDRFEKLPNSEFLQQLKLISDSIKLDSLNVDFFIDRGNLYFQQELIKEALDDFNSVIELNPKSFFAYHYRAILFASIGYADYAVYDNTQAIMLTENDSLKVGCINNRGNAKSMKRDHQGAFEDFLEVLKFDSTDFSGLTNISAELIYLERFDEAIVYLEKAIRLYPNDYGGYVNLAFLNVKMENYEKALELNNKALEIDSLQANAYNNRGFVKYKLGKNEDALIDINKSLELYPTNAFAYKNRSLVYISQNKIVLACVDLENAIEYGFTDLYGDEVKELQEKYCN